MARCHNRLIEHWTMYRPPLISMIAWKAGEELEDYHPVSDCQAFSRIVLVSCGLADRMAKR